MLDIKKIKSEIIGKYINIITNNTIFNGIIEDVFSAMNHIDVLLKIQTNIIGDSIFNIKLDDIDIVSFKNFSFVYIDNKNLKNIISGE